IVRTQYLPQQWRCGRKGREPIPGGNVSSATNQFKISGLEDSGQPVVSGKCVRHNAAPIFIAIGGRSRPFPTDHKKRWSAPLGSTAHHVKGGHSSVSLSSAF